jgi:hypothetical protein
MMAFFIMKSKLTDTHRYQLKLAIGLIQDSLDYETVTNPKILSVWLSVASDYCTDAVKTLKESIKD